jgi:V/A-type H+-transporting ATPase subunit C
MHDLAKYSFANAKIKAMLSYLLKPELFNRLADAKDIYEFMDMLKNTPYAQILKAQNKEKAQLQKIEKELLCYDLNIHHKIYDIFSSRQEKYFILLFTQYYEVEELKVILRIWHKKVEVNIEEYLLDAKVAFNIDFKRIMDARNIEEIILLLDHTPYGKALLPAREKFKERNSSFYLEAALDADYYQRLSQATNNFLASDRKIAQKILAIQIDIENINWLIRMKKYYSLEIGEMMQLLIPGGERVSKDSLRALRVSDDTAKIVESISTGPYAKLKELIETNIYFLEQFLYGVLNLQVRKALAGFPFTIGIALGYLILKRAETRSIISLMYAKILDIKRQEIEHLVNI